MHYYYFLYYSENEQMPVPIWSTRTMPFLACMHGMHVFLCSEMGLVGARHHLIHLKMPDSHFIYIRLFKDFFLLP